MPTTENQPLVFGGIALGMVCEFFHEVWVADWVASSREVWVSDFARIGAKAAWQAENEWREVRVPRSVGGRR